MLCYDSNAGKQKVANDGLALSNRASTALHLSVVRRAGSSICAECLSVRATVAYSEQSWGVLIFFIVVLYVILMNLCYGTGNRIDYLRCLCVCILLWQV